MVFSVSESLSAVSSKYEDIDRAAKTCPFSPKSKFPKRGKNLPQFRWLLEEAKSEQFCCGINGGGVG